MEHQSKIIVVGGGIMGASVAWHLSKAGAACTLIERAPECPNSATALSFGWVGAGASTPSDDPTAFDERMKALEEFARIERELGPLPIAVRGALVWRATEDETAALIDEHRTAGSRMEALARSQVVAKEPLIAHPPPLAAWMPGDFALEPIALAHQLLKAAQAAGTVIHHGAVETIEAAGSRITGVVAAGQRLTADKVVLANGFGARAAALTVGADLAIHETPAVLLRFNADTGDMRHLVCAQETELRPSRGGLVSAADYPEEGELGLFDLAARTGEAIARLFGVATAPSLRSVHAARRPMTADGVPICGPVGKLEGLYALVAHPGVILAPLLGRLCAEAVLNS